MAVLLLADHDGAGLKPATRSALAAAGPMAEDGVIDLLLLADTQAGAALAAEAAALPGLKRVRLAEHQDFAHPLPEQTAPLLARLMDDYDALIAPVGSFAKTHLPRAAALLDVQPVTEVLAVEDARTFLRPLYAGNALAKVRSLDKKRLVTVRAAAFEPVAAEGGSAAVEPLEAGLLESALAASGGGAEGTEDGASALSRWVGDETTKSERPDLANARVVISGGRGMQDGANFALLEKVADKLGAAVGASRAAVDAGFVSNEYQVGQTGKVVAPELYIAVGISGAIQHLAGMKDSKVIVAVNNDPEAPIFQVADYGLIADLFEALPELASAL